MLFLKTSSTIMNSHLYHCLFKCSALASHFAIAILTFLSWAEFSFRHCRLFSYLQKWKTNVLNWRIFFLLIHLLYVWIIVFFLSSCSCFWLFNWINRRVRDTCTKKRLNFLTTTFPSLRSCVRNKWIHEQVRFSWLKTFTF